MVSAFSFLLSLLNIYCRLASHIDDIELDSNVSRDYYISLCPKGSLCDAVKQYWDVCKTEYGWGQAQEHPPHLTIIPRFQVYHTFM